jgi:DNA repair exonuclease SbcCD ATPase subunit
LCWYSASSYNLGVPERKDLSDRQLEAILERLDRLCEEMRVLNRRLDSSDQLQRIARELSTLNESLQTLAYAALGQQGPQVRRRRSA